MNIEKILKVLFWFGFISAVIGMLLTHQSLSWFSPNSAMFEWGKFIGNIGRLVFMLVLVFRGTYFLRKDGFSKPYLIELLVGLGLLIVYLSIIAYSIKKIEAILYLDKNPSQVSVESILNSKISTVDKSSLSLQLSKRTFYFNGEITKYLNTTGDLVNYEPSPAEISEANERRGKINDIREAILKIKFNFWFYVTLLILVIVSSYVLAMRNKSLKQRTISELE